MENTDLIRNLDDPRLAVYKSLKAKPSPKSEIFIAESLPVVKKLLNTDIKILSCLTTERIFKKIGSLLSEKKRDFPVYLMRRADIEDMIGARFHMKIMMAAEIPERRDSLDRIKRIDHPHMITALNGVHDPQNVGLLIRNAAAFGTDLLMIDNMTYEPFYRKSVRISLGALFSIPTAYENNLPQTLKTLKKDFGTRIMVSTPSEKAEDLRKTDFSGNICIVLGNEACGVGADVLETADTLVRVPHKKHAADSLNVACSGAVLLYSPFAARNSA
jgi:tRNA G18 (ribose-2'-O)-methylase SpoU